MQTMRIYFFIFSYLLLIPKLIWAISEDVINSNNSGAGSLRAAITAVNGAGAGTHTITFKSAPGNFNITLLSPLDPIAVDVNISSELSPALTVVDGDNQYPIFIVESGNTVSVKDVSLVKGLHKGGNGGDGGSGGGAGLGKGGGFSTANGSTVTLENCIITNCKAEGGTGGNSVSPVTAAKGGGGGGSETTNGGTGTITSGGAGASPAGGGGGGPGASSPGPPGGPGGAAGGGTSTAGTAGSPTVGTNGGNGGNGGLGGVSTTASHGGGGGGGAGGRPDSGATPGNGGNGNNGSFGCGGGGAGGPGTVNGGSSGSPGIPGNGGFGGGNGGTAGPSVIGTGGGGGGGGAGFGGGLFIDQTSTVTIKNFVTSSLSQNTVDAGTGGTSIPTSRNGKPGIALGKDIFLESGGSLTFDLDSGTTLALSNPIQGDTLNAAGLLTLEGEGTLDFSTHNLTNTYKANTHISNGTLSIASDSNLGIATNTITFNTSLLASPTLKITEDLSTSRPIFLTGAQKGTISVNNGKALNHHATIDLSGARLLIEGDGLTALLGDISGTGSIQKKGSRTLDLRGNNSYTSGTIIDNGIVTIHNDNNLGDPSSSLVFDTNVSFSPLLSITSGSITSSRLIVITGNHNATIEVINETFNHSGILNLGTGQLTLDYRNTNSTFSGTINGSGKLIKDESGTVILSGNNSYSGGTNIKSGTVRISAENNLGVSPTLVNFKEGISPSLNIAGNVTTSRAIVSESGSNGTISINSSNQFDHSGSITFGVDSRLTLDCKNTTTASILSGAISGPGELIKNGAGELISTGTNNYSNGTVINDGILQITSAGNLGSNSGRLTFNTAATTNPELILNGTGNIPMSHPTFLTGNSSATITINNLNVLMHSGNIDLGSATLIIDNLYPVTGSTLSGTISGSGGLVKQGVGELLLSGTNSYSGGNVISAGTLTGTTNSIKGDVNNNGTLLFDQTTTGTFSGNITGSGNLEKEGSGSVLLRGTNTYAGTTALNEGTLNIATSNNLGSNTLLIAGGTLQGTETLTLNNAIDLSQPSTINVAGNTTMTLQGIISNSGDLTKQGSGTLAFAKTNLMTGTTTIENGTVQLVGGTIADVIVNAGTKLSGNGTTNTVTNKGTVAPGASIGTINIVGDYTQDSSGILEIELNDSGDADKLIVSGTTTLDGILKVFEDPGYYRKGEEFLIIDSSITTGTFSQIISQRDNVYSLKILSNDVFLVLEEFNVAFPLDQLTGNALIMAEYLTTPCIESASFINGFLDELSDLPIDELQDALEQMTPVRFRGTTFFNFENHVNICRILENKVFCWNMCNFRNQTIQMCYCAGDVNLWVQPFYFWTQQGERLNQIPYKGFSLGGLFGADYLFTDYFLAGITAGLSGSNMSWTRSLGNGYLNNGYLGIYSTMFNDQIFLHTSAHISADYYDLSRVVKFTDFCGTTYNQHWGFDYTLHCGIGANLFCCNRFYFKPFFDFDFIDIQQNAYNEFDCPSIDLRVNSRRDQIMRTLLALYLSKEFPLREASLNYAVLGGWICEKPLTNGKYRARLRETDCAGCFVVDSFNALQTKFTVGGSIDYHTCCGTRTYLGYIYEGGQQSVQHNATLRLEKTY